MNYWHTHAVVKLMLIHFSWQVIEDSISSWLATKLSIIPNTLATFTESIVAMHNVLMSHK